jgi:hypothetical protein
VLANGSRVAHHAHEKKDVAGLVRGLGINLLGGGNIHANCR